MSEEIKSEEQLEAEAAEWFTAMHSGEVDTKTRKRFEAWLHGDRAHKIAYREFEQVYRDLDFVVEKAGINIDEALGRTSFNWGSLIPDWVKKPNFARGLTFAAAAAAVLISPSFFAPTIHGPTATMPKYTTQIAEIREVTLEDGSIVTLAPKSRIEAEFTATRRHVTLLTGEAFFDVAKDPSRPFFVAAQDTLVRVVGTKFDVKRSADIVHVSVLEGIVEVMKPNNIEQAIASADTSDIDKQILTAGERVSAARRVALPQARQVKQIEPGSWRQGRLAYENASLAEIVADLNRYYDRPIRIASSEIGDLRSTLAFQTTDIEQVFDVMSAIHPIEVETQFSGEIVLRRKR